MIELIAVLNGGIVHFSGELAYADQIVRRVAGLIAAATNIVGRLAARLAFAAADDQVQVAAIFLRRSSLSAPQTVVVTPLECQSKPNTQPNA